MLLLPLFIIHALREKVNAQSAEIFRILWILQKYRIIGQTNILNFVIFCWKKSPGGGYGIDFATLI
jgi:hypothetical protein